MDDNIFIRYADMPITIKSYTILNPDMTFTIILNSKLTREQNIISYAHEYNHIINNDYDKKMDINLLEICAHAENLK